MWLQLLDEKFVCNSCMMFEECDSLCDQSGSMHFLLASAVASDVWSEAHVCLKIEEF